MSGGRRQSDGQGDWAGPSGPWDSEKALVACPAYKVCAEFGTVRRTCRYDRDALPPVGMSTHNPEDAWCQPGVVTLILILAERAGTRP